MLQLAQCGIVVAGIPTVMMFPWLARNWLIYSDPLGSAVASRLLGAIFPPVQFSSWEVVQMHLQRSLDHLSSTFWFGEPFSPWAHWEFAFSVFSAVSYAAVAGTFFRIGREMRDERSEQWKPPLLMVASVVILIAELLIAPVFGGLGVVGRYLYPSLIPAIGLVWLGMASIIRREAWAHLALVLIGGLVLLDLLNYWDYLKINYG